MQDRPTIDELLQAVRDFIETDVVPALEGPKKFHARVAANVLNLVRRELDLEEAALRREWHGLDNLLGAVAMPDDARSIRRALRKRNDALCQRIQQGEADSGAWRDRTLQHVYQTVRDKLAVTNPKFVK